MEQTVEVKNTEERPSEPYQEPLLIKHEPLRDITGTVKYGEKLAGDKAGTETTD